MRLAQRRFADEAVAPHVVEQLVLGHHTIAMGDEVDEHVEHLTFDVDRLTPAAQLEPVDVDLEVIEDVARGPDGIRSHGNYGAGAGDPEGVSAVSRIARPLAALALVVGAVAATGSVASAATITVSPTTVAVGGSVDLSGDVLAGDGTPGCGVPGTVTLISDAFAGLGEFAGVGAVDLPVDATGHFDSTVTLDGSVASGTYTITGRCGGGNLGVEASIVVGDLPPTGPGVDIVPWVWGSAALVVIGLALLALSRRPVRSREVSGR